MIGTLRATTVALGILLGFAPGAEAATIGSDSETVTYSAAPGKVNRVAFTEPAPGTIRIDRLDGDDDPIVNPGIAECVEVVADETYDCAGSLVAATAGDLDDVFESQVSTPTEGHNTFDGGAGGDSLTGGPGNDEFDGESGDDELVGNGGDDVFVPDVGSDTAVGGPGSDWFNMSTEGGDVDVADGGPGDDVVLLPSGPFDVRGGSGRDRLIVLAQNPDTATAEDHSYTPDDVANDGAPGQNGNAHSDFEDFEDLYGSLSSFVPEGSVIADIGRYVLVGTPGHNSLIGGMEADSLDGKEGNDLLSGHRGDDTIQARDGYADVVRCGQGQDSVTADTLDQVSETCESVDTQNVGNANDTPENAPPTVAFTAPAAGATLGSGVTLITANAADDQGVARVLFMDDDRIVCTDTAAPYTCDYQPRGEDVGRNTLAVMAVDGAEQTATAFLPVNVPRFNPAGLAFKVTPGRDRRAPFRFRFSGRLNLPSQVAPALGCAGESVLVRFKAGKKTVASRRAALRPDCTFRSRVTVPRRHRNKTLRAQAAFAGNEVLANRRSARKRVRTR